MNTITISLSIPPPELSPNGRYHWAAKSRQVKKYRAQAQLLCRAQTYEKPRWKQATVSVVWYHPDRRRRDRDNLQASLKAAFDGIADAGIVDNDSGLIHLPAALEIDRQNPRVEITIAKCQPGELPVLKNLRNNS